MLTYEKELEFASKLAIEAQEIALKYFSFETDSTWKEDGTPLTASDTEINDLVIKRIHEEFPNHSVYGEEGSHIKENSEYIWVCDPIDGTMAYECGLPIFVFSIALIEQKTGLPILGLISDPIMKTTYWAIKGHGAYRNGVSIKVSSKSSFRNTYASTGGSGRAVGFTSLPLMKILSEEKCAVMRYPSFIYGAIQVANGKYIGSVFYGSSGHDVAALKIITEEAGGKVTDLEGNERRYDSEGLGCIVSNGILHNDLINIVQKGNNSI